MDYLGRQAGVRVFFIGFMGAGKTYWARQVATKLNVDFYDLDVLIADREQKTIAQIFVEEKEEGFRKKERQMLLSCAQLPNFVMSCGGGTPCFYDNMDFMNQIGNTVFLEITKATLLNRLLQERMHRPLLKDKNDSEIQEFITQKLAERLPFYTQATYTIPEKNISLYNFLHLIKSSAIWKGK